MLQEENEHRDESNVPFEDFEEITHADAPGKGNSVKMFQKRNREIKHLNNYSPPCRWLVVLFSETRCGNVNFLPLATDTVVVNS